jgi:hypothetical protein
MINQIKVANFVDRFHAEMAQSELAAAGITCQVIADDAGAADQFLLSGSGGVWLAVLQQDVEAALELLDRNQPVNQEELEAEAMSYDPPADL